MKTYSKLILTICSVVVLLLTMLHPPNQAKASNSELSLNLISNLSQDKTEVTVALDLNDNIGLSMMMLTLDYDMKVFTLIEVERGTALSKMDFKTTSSTQYNISPYRLMWSDGIKNNAETGIIAKLTFTISKDISPNTYPISVTYRKDSDIVRYNNLDSPTYVNLNLNNSLIDLTAPKRLNLNWVWQALLSIIALFVIIYLLFLIQKEKCFAKQYENLQLHKRKSIHTVIFELVKYKGAKVILKRDRLKCYLFETHLFDVIIKNNNPIILTSKTSLDIQGKGKLKPAILEIRQIVENANPLDISEYSKNPNSSFIREMCLQYLKTDNQNKESKNNINKSRTEFYCD